MPVYATKVKYISAYFPFYIQKEYRIDRNILLEDNDYDFYYRFKIKDYVDDLGSNIIKFIKQTDDYFKDGERRRRITEASNSFEITFNHNRNEKSIDNIPELVCFKSHIAVALFKAAFKLDTISKQHYLINQFDDNSCNFFYESLPEQ
jgi:hypothetical protein